MVLQKVRFYRYLCNRPLLNGNTTVPKDPPWEIKVELFCRGFENAYEEGRKIGLDVFFDGNIPIREWIC